jgi:hypothetical protein
MTVSKNVLVIYEVLNLQPLSYHPQLIPLLHCDLLPNLIILKSTNYYNKHFEYFFGKNFEVLVFVSTV